MKPDVVRNLVCVESQRFQMSYGSLPKIPGPHSPSATIAGRCPQYHLRISGLSDRYLGHQPFLRVGKSFEYLKGLHFLHWEDNLTKLSESRMNDKDEGLCNLRACSFKSLLRLIKARNSRERDGENELLAWAVMGKA